MNKCEFCDGKIAMVRYEKEFEHWECLECTQLYVVYTAECSKEKELELRIELDKNKAERISIKGEIREMLLNDNGDKNYYSDLRYLVKRLEKNEVEYEQLNEELEDY